MRSPDFTHPLSGKDHAAVVVQVSGNTDYTEPQTILEAHGSADHGSTESGQPLASSGRPGRLTGLFAATLGRCVIDFEVSVSLPLATLCGIVPRHVLSLVDPKKVISILPLPWREARMAQ